MNTTIDMDSNMVMAYINTLSSALDDVHNMPIYLSFDEVNTIKAKLELIMSSTSLNMYNAKYVEMMNAKEFFRIPNIEHIAYEALYKCLGDADKIASCNVSCRGVRFGSDYIKYEDIKEYYIARYCI